MASDPNGARWSKSAKNFGKNLLKKSGWTEGSGIGKDGEGIASHVKVSRKDDVTGIGYKAGVQETWSAQSVGFADVLDRIKTTAASPIYDSDEDSADGDHSGDGTSIGVASPTSSDGSRRVAESRHFKMYAKRNALKTELLRSQCDDKREEILGSASSSKRPRDGGAEGVHKARNWQRDDVEVISTLVSPLLKRLMTRCSKDEPKPSADDENASDRVTITKPNPRPAKCTDSPFLA